MLTNKFTISNTDHNGLLHNSQLQCYIVILDHDKEVHDGCLYINPDLLQVPKKHCLPKRGSFKIKDIV